MSLITHPADKYHKSLPRLAKSSQAGPEGGGVPQRRQGGPHGPGRRGDREPLPDREDRPGVGGPPGRHQRAGPARPAAGELMREAFFEPGKLPGSEPIDDEDIAKEALKYDERREGESYRGPKER